MSNKEERKAPVLRFKGFTDDWEQRKFGDFWKLKSGKAYKASEYVNKGIPIINGETIKNGEIKSNNLNYLPKRYLLIKDNIILKPDDVVIGLNRPIINNQLKISPIPKNIPVSFLYQRAGKIESKFSNLSTIETYYLLERNIFNFSKITAIGSDQPFIKTSALLSWKFFIPKEIEEKTINKLLAKISTLIFLQQRKLSLIEKLRENISEHIFSPDIMKFKNIDPEFEIKKLSNISNIFIGLVTTMTKNYAKNGILLIRNSNIKENNFKFDNYIYLDSKFAEKNKNREMKIGDVVTVHTGDIGTSAVIEPKEENSIGFATITTRPNNKIINSYYLSDYLNTKKHKNWAVRISTGDGRRNYNLKDFTRIRLNVPSLNYQIKIVALIKYLESFSKSEKKKINQLNSLKQFLLQNLFI